MKTLTSLLTSLIISSTASAQFTIIADAAADYLTAPDYVADTTAPTAPPTGWEYLNSDMANGGTETPLTPQTTLGNGGNMGFGVNSGTANFQVGVIGGPTGGAEYELFDDGFESNGGIIEEDILIHPGNNDATPFVIVRYTISAQDLAGGNDFNIIGSFREQVLPNNLNNNNGGSVDVFVYHNSTELFALDQPEDQTPEGGLSQDDGTFNITGLIVAEGDTISFVVGNNGIFFGDETALQATISQGPIPAEGGPEISINQIPASDELEISFLTVAGLFYNLRSSTDLSTDPTTWDIVEGQSGLDSTASPIIIPRPTDPKRFYVIESFED